MFFLKLYFLCCHGNFSTVSLEKNTSSDTNIFPIEINFSQIYPYWHEKNWQFESINTHKKQTSMQLVSFGRCKCRQLAIIKIPVVFSFVPVIPSFSSLIINKFWLWENCCVLHWYHHSLSLHCLTFTPNQVQQINPEKLWFSISQYFTADNKLMEAAELVHPKWIMPSVPSQYGYTLAHALKPWAHTPAEGLLGQLEAHWPRDSTKSVESMCQHRNPVTV